MRKWFFMLFTSVMLLAGVLPAAMVRAETQPVPAAGVTVVIPVEQTIETGLEKYVRRAFAEAEALNADRVVLEINTYGGRVDAAENIGALVQASKAETIAFVREKAVSAGAFIAINADRIIMTPGSSIGSAAVVDQSGTLVQDPKTVAHWVSKMRSAAESNGRKPDIAHGMVDTSIVVEMPEIARTKQKGELVSLTAEEAVKVGYAQGIASSRQEVLASINAEQTTVVVIEPTAAEKVARFLTNPATMAILFIIGIAGILIELFVPGFGIPGLAGMGAFALYFFGQYIAGFAGVEDVILFIAGIILLLLELFVPSFGILGILGFAGIIGGVVLAAYDSQNALATLGYASLAALVIAGVFIWYFRHKGIWNKFILRDRLGDEEGYFSSESKKHLVGLKGITVTPLRPSGTAELEGARYDVVSESQFIGAGVSIVVVKTDGTRIVVKEVRE
ncbi:NfeD family protein [Paenibacillus turpanensis]|uniref:NfeD family protein n=1 Tax=Paenibacillus turpanensis TaxID=2689078 RepID=UPI00140DD96E|nr:nodulation protein NfeD [Paenibacillus turpanensis]